MVVTIVHLPCRCFPPSTYRAHCPPLHSPVACAASPWIGIRWVCCSCVSPTCMSPYKATHTPVPLHIHSAWPEMGNQCVRGPNYWPAIYPVPLQQPSEVCACFSGRESCFNIVRLMVKWEWADIESTLEHFACLPSVPTIAAHCNPSLVLRYVAVRSRPQCSESLAERERVGCEHLWCVHPTLSLACASEEAALVGVAGQVDGRAGAFQTRQQAEHSERYVACRHSNHLLRAFTTVEFALSVWSDMRIQTHLTSAPSACAAGAETKCAPDQARSISMWVVWQQQSPKGEHPCRCLPYPQSLAARAHLYQHASATHTHLSSRRCNSRHSRPLPSPLQLSPFSSSSLLFHLPLSHRPHRVEARQSWVCTARPPRQLHEDCVSTSLVLTLGRCPSRRAAFARCVC